MNRLTVIIITLAAFVVGVTLSARDIVPARIQNKIANFGSTPQPKRFQASARFDYSMPIDPNAQGTADQGNVAGEPAVFYSPKLESEITILPGVFYPYEAEWTTLPLLQQFPELCKDQTVLEIGTGSGIISLYCAKLGAKKVIATDVNPAAIETIRLNAEKLGLSDIIDARLVSRDNASAYAVIGDDEKFNLILSNPPFALDLDAPRNDSVTDNGQLSFSIVRGLDKHLEAGGKSILYYDELFFHEVMVKYARHLGFEVRNHRPNGFFPWSAETLFNSYLTRLLEYEGMEPGTLSFDYHTDPSLSNEFLRNAAFNPQKMGFEPLLPPVKTRYFAGSIVVERPSD
jgi:release factor glutamine methyltransferase